MNASKNIRSTREQEICRVTLTGSVANALLLAAKFVAGILGNSAAMIADAVHSLSDFATDIIVIIFVRISGKPEDKEHDYGHGKFETMATLLIGIILLFVGLGIFWNGASDIYDATILGRQLETPGMIAFVAAIASIVLKEALYHYTVRCGKALNSQTVIANAWHHRSDAFSSIGTAIGIGGAILLGRKWAILDPMAAVIVSFFICKVAMQLTIPCIEELLEKSLPEETERAILEIVREFPEASDPHHLRTRRIGSYCAIEMHIRMNGKTTLEQAHSTASEIENRIKAYLGESTIVSIHLEPEKPTLTC